ncbi:MAG: putative toxin-antitoxin system toxin component, PIN family [Propionibacteriaceae bacterium]|nr:putative toxin-antitoxin system toxin component, PIN family [Propionibacteriaceae bacterium]
MRVLVDTNVLISAFVFPQGLTAQAFARVIDSDDEAMVCGYSVAELYDVVSRKFPRVLSSLPEFMAYLTQGVRFVSTPTEPIVGEIVLRDEGDQPILRAALASGADVILTGDRDILDAGMDYPQALTATAYLARS